VLQEWSQWAIQAAIRPEVIAFLRFRPELLSAFDRICLYLNRLPTEFRVLCVRDATLREPAILCTAGYTKWAAENHHAIA